MNTKSLLGWLAGATFLITSGCSSGGLRCTTDRGATSSTDDAGRSALSQSVKFNGDSAYSYVEHQVAMGPRVPGSSGSAHCIDYIASELRRHNADTVKLQTGTVRAFNGDMLPITNIMGSFNSPARKRVLLAAHFDTRPWADNDAVEENRREPIPGANDGASGVGVLLEVARQIGQKSPEIGVDMLFVDAEDYGQTSGFSNHDETWCLGTQYWAENMPYTPDSMPSYGILLDMVGGMGAKFHREYFSHKNMPDLVDKVWSIAEKSGYGDRFINVPGGGVVDDHVFLSKAGIPTINIIESKSDDTMSFPSTWHTLNDDMDHIDPSTLKAVGQTVVNVIYNETI